MAGRIFAGWGQVGACMVLMATGSMITSTYSVLAVPLSQEFQPSRMVLMLAMTIMAGVSGITSPIFGNLMDRMRMRNLMLAGALAISCGYFALSFATSFPAVLIIFGLLIAPGNVLVGPMPGSVLLSRWFVRRRGTALGVAISGVAIGTLVYAPVIQGLLNAFEWRTAFRVLALILFVVTVPAALRIVNAPQDLGLHPDGDDHDPSAEHAGPQISSISIREILTDGTFWIAAAMFSVVLSGMAGMITNLVPLARDVGIDANAAALLVTIYGAGGICAKLGFAAIADRISLRHLIFACLAGYSVGMACLSRAESGYGMIAAGVFLVGFCGGFFVPLQGLLVPRAFGQKVMGRVTGLLSFVTLCALLASPPIFGRIFDVTGTYDAIFYSYIVLAALILLLVPRLRMEGKEPATAMAMA